MYMFCCPKCHKFYMNEIKEAGTKCDICQGLLVPLKVSDAVWKAMSKEEKRDLIQMAINNAKKPKNNDPASDMGNSFSEAVPQKEQAGVQKTTDDGKELSVASAEPIKNNSVDKNQPEKQADNFKNEEPEPAEVIPLSNERMYVCPKCRKVFKINGAGKKAKCTKCQDSYVVDMNVYAHEWTTFPTSKKADIVSGILDEPEIIEVVDNFSRPKQNPPVIYHQSGPVINDQMPPVGNPQNYYTYSNQIPPYQQDYYAYNNYETANPNSGFNPPTNSSYISQDVTVDNVRKKKKDSVLSIIAAILTILGITSFFGFIIGIIDLIFYRRDGKRHLGSWFAIVLGTIILGIFVTRLSNNKDTKNTQAKTEQSVEKPSSSAEGTTDASNAISNRKDTVAFPGGTKDITFTSDEDNIAKDLTTKIESYEFITADTFENILGDVELVFVFKAKTDNRAIKLEMLTTDSNGNVLDKRDEVVAVSSGHLGAMILYQDKEKIGGHDDLIFKFTVSEFTPFMDIGSDNFEIVNYNLSDDTLYITTQAKGNDVDTLSGLGALFYKGDKLLGQEITYPDAWDADGKAIMSMWLNSQEMNYDKVLFYYL